MSELDLIQLSVKDEMRKFDNHFRASLKSKVPFLDIITNYIIKQKRIQLKTILVFLSAKLSGEINNQTYVAASLVEFLHSATLIHEDVTDESNSHSSIFPIRTLWTSKISVLLGDYLLAKGLLLSVQNKSYSLLEIISNAVKEMSEGELLQIESSQIPNFKHHAYLEVIRKKNASVISACTTIGAVSSNATKEMIEKMKLFGINLGMAIQIKNDINTLEIKGLNKKKETISIQKLFNLPLIYSLENSNNFQKEQFFKLINKNNESININNIMDFINNKDGILFSKNILSEFKNKALLQLHNLPETAVKKSIVDLVEYSTRTKN
jgi:octaprenyl-diphosphate synthase